MSIKWHLISNIEERDIIFLMREFSKVLPFVIRSTRHRNLCDTPPHVRIQCDSLHAIHRVSRVCIPGARASVLFATRAARIYARKWLRNVNNGESSPEWPAHPTPCGTIVRLLGRGFFPVFQRGRGCCHCSLSRPGNATSRV